MDCPVNVALINPHIRTGLSTCRKVLSVDGLRGKVTRPSLVRVQALDRDGEPVDFEATSLVRVHPASSWIVGKVFLDRMTDMSTLTQLEELEKVLAKTIPA